MAINDLQAFIRERVALYNNGLDTSQGSAFDREVLQPLVRRIGQDPWTIDTEAFLQDRLQQAFPDLAVSDGDVLADTLIKPLRLLLDPVVREVTRVGRRLSLRDPSTLTLDEIDDLGANLVAVREQGDISRGVARLLFSSPQNQTITPANVILARSGLRYFPSGTQAIRLSEMILNQAEDGLYYFDVSCEAEAPGVQYDIGPGSLTAIGNVPSCVKVTNPRRFRGGLNSESAQEFAAKIPQSLSERSMTSLRGIAGKLQRTFPEIRRLNVIGFGDPEMRRDLITGGSLGDVVLAGQDGFTIADSSNQQRTRWFSSPAGGFLNALVGDDGWVLTVFGAFGSTELVRDLDVLRTIDDKTLEVVDRQMLIGSSGLTWTLRRREILLSGLPGGIVVPTNERGTTSVKPTEVHVGGCADIVVSADTFEEATLVISNVQDQQLELSGLSAGNRPLYGDTIFLDDYRLGVTFQTGDEVWTKFQAAAKYRWTLEIRMPSSSAIYRYKVTNVLFTFDNIEVQPAVALSVGPHPEFTLTGGAQWRLYGELELSLTEPSDVLYQAGDLQTVQGSQVVTTGSLVNFTTVRVTTGAQLIIADGPNAGQYTVTEPPLSPGLTSLQVDRPLPRTLTNQDFQLVIPNPSGGMRMPFSRISKIELLDQQGASLGCTVPLRDPVDVQSRAFQNPGRGVKYELGDVAVGIVSRALTFPLDASLSFNLKVGGLTNTFTLTSTFTSLDHFIQQIGLLTEPLYGFNIAIALSTDRFGIRGISADSWVFDNSGCLVGTDPYHPATDIRSDRIAAIGGWFAQQPLLDLSDSLEAVELLSGPVLGAVPGQLTVEGDAIRTTTVFPPAYGVTGRFGARSIGSCRAFWLEPTSCEVGPDTRFTLEQPDGQILEFMPDPTLGYQLLPPTGGDPLTDGQLSGDGDTFQAVGQNFAVLGVRPKDQLRILRQPLTFQSLIAEQTTALIQPGNEKTLVWSLDGGPDRTLIFFRDDLTLPANTVSAQGIVDQINAAVGEPICSLDGDVFPKALRFELNRNFTIRKTGTANPLILGNLQGKLSEQDTSLYDQNNLSPVAGTYVIQGIGQDQLFITTTFPPSSTQNPAGYPWPVGLTEQEYVIDRAGHQRCGVTQMSQQTDVGGLYWADFELVSVGVGDHNNISADLQLKARGLDADGYRIINDAAEHTFSILERPRIQISDTIIKPGDLDQYLYALDITGKGLKITYDRSPVVESVQNFATSDAERVVNSNPLAKQLTPNFIRFDLRFTGGRDVDTIRQEMQRYVRALSPIEPLEATEIVRILHANQATGVDAPFTLLSIEYRADRTVWVQRSQDQINTSRLSLFIPDQFNLNRQSF